MSYRRWRPYNCPCGRVLYSLDARVEHQDSDEHHRMMRSKIMREMDWGDER